VGKHLDDNLSFMPVRIYAHLSWTTFARAPLIDERIAESWVDSCWRKRGGIGARAIELGIVRDQRTHAARATGGIRRAPNGSRPQGSQRAARETEMGSRTQSAAHGRRDMTCGRLGWTQLRGVAEYVREQKRRHGDVRPSGRA